MDNQQINKLVAEKVMGWKLIKRSLRNSEGHYDALCWDEGHVEQDYFRPSTNIKDAWLVIKALEEKMFIADLSIWRDENECVFTPLDYETKYEEAASTIEMAICLAALKSVGVEVSD